MDWSFIESLKPDASYVTRLHPRLWLMDCHKWALYAWESSLRPQLGHEQGILAHLDYHLDASNDFTSAEDVERLLRAAGSAGCGDLTAGDNLIKCDSFIVPAIMRGLIRDVHFFCRETDPDPGVYDEWLDSYDGPQFYHERLEDLLVALAGKCVLFDLCLDLFNGAANKSYRSDLWPDADVVGLIDDCGDLIRDARLVTVSLSFSHSGTESDTRHLARVVLPRVLHHLGRTPHPDASPLSAGEKRRGVASTL
jgi:hypothetical protein